jgi:glycosyltransferase 2 family protein
VTAPGSSPTPRPGATDPAERPSAGRGALRRGVQLLLTIGVTWLILRQVGVSRDEALSLEAALPEPSLALLLLSSLLLLGGFVWAAALWGRMARELGGPTLGAGASVRIVFTANLGRYLPGKVWQMAGLAVLARREGMSATVAATAGVLGQTFLLAAAGIWGAPLLLGLDEGRLGILLALTLLAGFVVLMGIPAALRRTLGVAFRLARIPPDRVPALDALFGLRWLGLYLLLWGVYGAAFVLLVRGLGLQGGVLELGPPFAAAYLLGYVALFAPAGIGVREGFLIAFLRPGMGVAAVGVAVLARVWMTVVELLPAGVVAIREVFRSPEDELRGEAPGALAESANQVEEVDG